MQIMIYYYFQFVFAVLKMRKHFCLHNYNYFSVANNIQSNYIFQRCVRVS